MCGRYLITTPIEAILALFGVPDFDGAELAPRYNVAPSQAVPAVRLAEGGEGRVLASLRWGLVPHWAKDAAIGSRLINARAESVADKPSFRDSFRHRRCLVVADGFYEWQSRARGRKQPFLIRLKDGGPFGMAGLWSRWQPQEGEPVETCTIITTAANTLCASIHDRMPVIVPPDAHAAWLDPAHAGGAALLVPYDAAAMEAWPVSPRVGNPRNDDAGLIVPLPRQMGLI